jgi:hypothetical protein
VGAIADTRAMFDRKGGGMKRNSYLRLGTRLHRPFIVVIGTATPTAATATAPGISAPARSAASACSAAAAPRGSASCAGISAAWSPARRCAIVRRSVTAARARRGPQRRGHTSVLRAHGETEHLNRRNARDRHAGEEQRILDEILPSVITEQAP